MKQTTVMPKPRMALQIGITGHRSNKIEPAGRPALEQALRTLYAMIGKAIAEIALETHGRIYLPDAPLIRIVSGLAEGTDRIGVIAAPADWRLEAILPMPRAEYARDFLGPAAASDSNAEFERLLARAASVTELPLLPAVNVREEAGRAQHYQALGAFLIRQIDLLVAVWDGKPARGPGGTAGVIARAFNEGRPVLWIDPKDPAMPRRLLTVDTAAHNDHRWQTLEASGVDRLLREILVPPVPTVSADHGHHGAQGGESSPAEHGAAMTTPRLPAYFGLRWPKPMRWAFAYNLLRRLSGAGRWSWPITYPSYDDLAKSWDGFFAATTGTASGGTAEFNARVRSILLPRSIWADALAWYYAHLYRSAYVSIFILAGLSVPVGLGYLFFLESPAVLDIKAGFVVLELLIISTVVFVVRRGIRQHWHAVWLQTRELSELLRLGRSPAYVGALRDFVATPHAGGETIPSWFVRATFREIGLPSGVLDAAYLRHVLTATLTTEIQEQRAYHTADARNLTKIHHTLHHKGDACFAATIYVLLFYIAVWVIDRFFLPGAAHAEEHGAALAHPHGPIHEFLEYVVKPIVSIAAAGLPALGAALSGIRAQGDFEGFAQRSATTHHELTEVEQQIGALLAAPDEIDLKAATDVLLAATRVMARDVSAWHQIYVSKRLTLPA
jgi:hypothetical protein